MTDDFSFLGISMVSRELVLILLVVVSDFSRAETPGDVALWSGNSNTTIDDKQAVIFGMRAEMPPDEITPFGYRLDETYKSTEMPDLNFTRHCRDTLRNYRCWSSICSSS